MTLENRASSMPKMPISVSLRYRSQEIPYFPMHFSSKGNSHPHGSKVFLKADT